MKLKPYPEYKDSGVEWIGTIPHGWEVHKLKFLISDLESGGREKGGGNNLDEGIFSLGGEHINWNGTLKVDNLRFISERYYNSMQSGKLKINDILLVKDGATIGKTAILNKMPFGKMAVNEHVFIIRPNNKIIPKLLYYLICGDSGFTQIKLTETGSAQGGINLEFTGKVKVTISPQISDQKYIINYLDKKTFQIDKTIEKDTQLIELLKEKRTALINHAVTKGMDPDAKMKDSGVEWIGEIPEDWGVRKFSHISDKIVVGYVGSIESFYTDAEEGVPLLKTGNVDYGKINFEKLNYVTREFHLKNKKSQLKPGDIVVARHGESGRSSVIPDSLKEANCLNIVVLKSGKKMDGSYYSYVLNSHLIQERLQAIQGGAVQGVVNTEDIAFLKVLCPPLEEQQEIVGYINEKTSNLDETIQKIEKKIELLEEYKKSLIHHVVTGKVDVRGEVVV